MDHAKLVVKFISRIGCPSATPAQRQVSAWEEQGLQLGVKPSLFLQISPICTTCICHLLTIVMHWATFVFAADSKLEGRVQWSLCIQSFQNKREVP